MFPSQPEGRDTYTANPMTGPSPSLVAAGLVKQYGGVVALDGAGIELHPGEVHGLVGENGAGKSTLVKVVSGAVRPDAGAVRLAGRPLAFGDARRTARLGVAIVAQELSLFPDLSVLENLYVDVAPRRFGLVSHKLIAERAAPVLEELGLAHVPLRAPAGTLDPADQQLVEISKALLREPRVLILDEPTSSLPADAVARLESVLRGLAERGLAILYISHFLEEVLRIARRVSVMRDGRDVISGRASDEVPLERLVAAMLGEEPPEAPPPAPGPAETGRHDGVRFTGVSVPDRLRDVSLRAAPGEIVGVAGLAGSGHHAVLEVVCGRARPSSGLVRLPGDAPAPRGLRAAIRAGVAFVPGDRKRYGLMLDQTVWENIGMVGWLALDRGGPFLRRKKMAARAAGHVDRLALRGDPYTRTGDLSGGSQQKVVFAKWMDTDPAVVVLDDPTRGVDVGARAEMHAIVRELAASEKVVLLASSDLPELAELCHRVLVFQRGRVVTELSGAELTDHAISLAMNAGHA